ncbi:Chemotaxis protein CheW [Gammaproteobacteria bacterium]
MRKPVHAYRATNLSYLTRFMSSLHADQSRLRDIQAVYDNLTLLGQLLCAGTDITSMRTDFNNLANMLLDQLAKELRKKAELSLGSSARMAIDILIRNLFERTADIGFLATDMDVRHYAEAVEENPAVVYDKERRSTLKERFSEYVRKYSVYHNIILLSPQGQMLVQLDDDNPVGNSHDSLICQALTTDQSYVETFRACDLLKQQDTPLIYSYRVMSEDGSHPVGVLCLCFRFQDECRRIFANLVADDDWTVVTILDQEGKIIASSDTYQFPVGAKVERVINEQCHVVRFAGREYLATTRSTMGYQGYMGPGWMGHTLSPLNHAFEMAEAHELERVNEELVNCVLEAATLFTSELRDIPVRAASIQRELNRAVWNGSIWLSRDSYALNASFAKVLLWEIGSTGVKTRNVFSESTTNLYKTVVSSVLYDCGTQAALAIDIMDRNLYERANDCRWWALTSVFRAELANLRPGDREQRRVLTDILCTINSLYTVYSNLLIFDISARVVAVSNPAYTELLGQTLPQDWVRQTLGLPDTQSYCVSSFSASKLYGGHPTYVYAAAIREPNGSTPVGGIAIVFDSTPQFKAMLEEALPRKENGSVIEGAFAVFAERDGRIIASTDGELKPGERFDIGREFFELVQGAGCTNIVIFRKRYYAVGSAMSAGYREYKNERDFYRNDVVCLVLSPLSDSVIDPASLHSLRDVTPDNYALRHRVGDEDSVEIATFYISGGWYGVRSDFVMETFEAKTITRLPGMPTWVRGCVVHNDIAITVYDLAGLLPGVKELSQSCQIVVVKVPNQQLRYGILIDELGEIPEIAATQIKPLPSMMSSDDSPIESLVRPHADVGKGQALLMILSAERMLQSLAKLKDVPKLIDSRPQAILEKIQGPAKM